MPNYKTGNLRNNKQLAAQEEILHDYQDMVSSLQRSTGPPDSVENLERYIPLHTSYHIPRFLYDGTYLVDGPNTPLQYACFSSPNQTFHKAPSSFNFEIMLSTSSTLPPPCLGAGSIYALVRCPLGKEP